MLGNNIINKFCLVFVLFALFCGISSASFAQNKRNISEDNFSTRDAFRLLNDFKDDKDDPNTDPTPPQKLDNNELKIERKDNFITKAFQKIYGDFDDNLSGTAVTAIICIALLGLYMLRSSPIIGLIMILAPTSVYYFIQKVIKFLN